MTGPQTAAALTEQLRQNPRIIEDTLRQMLEQGQVSQDGETWQITQSGRNALVSANDSGTEVLNQIREAIGASACDQLVAGMRGALAALQKVA
jgi:predicted transcriptional regulator